MYLGRHGGGWQVKGENSEIIAQEGGIFPDKDHQKNFIECLRTRKKPNGDVEQGHLSASLVHMGNISYRLGNRHLLFDRVKEKFADDEANKYLTPSFRGNYKIPEKI